MHPIADRVFDVGAALVKCGVGLMAAGVVVIIIAVLLAVHLKS